jgi:hypothetical protein
VITAMAVIGVYVVRRLFGAAELLLVRNYLATGIFSLFGSSPNGYAYHSEIHLQGSADWDLLWKRLTAQASELALTFVRLDVNAPAVYEEYHARWECRENGSQPGGEWRAEIPLTVHGQPTGRIEAIGRRGLEPVSAQMATLMEFAESFEAVVAELGKNAEPAVHVTKHSAAFPMKVANGEYHWKLANAELTTNDQNHQTHETYEKSVIRSP